MTASWVPVPDGSDFPLENLPYGVFSVGGQPARVGVAIGDAVLDLSVLAEAGVLHGVLPDAAAACAAPALNPLMDLGGGVWSALRARLTGLLAEGDAEIRDRGLTDRALLPREEVRLHLPFEVADYVDFYSSQEHATNLGRMFRPDGDPLLPNWRHLPVGYHGRAGTVVASGTPVVRPRGQSRPPGSDAPVFGPTRRLDIELEVGFVTGGATALGTAVPAGSAEEHIFGLLLVNDWSARDIQAWEYQPLGPFLGKSFATSVSPWVVPLAALAPYRCPGPPQDPPALDHLAVEGDRNVDLSLEVGLRSAEMADRGMPSAVVSRTSFSHMYWAMAQQLAHVTSNGARLRTGDLYASGTVSGRDPDTLGSLIELTWNGERPLRLPDGTERTFLEDGDEVTLRGWCGGDGRPRIGFGEVKGTIAPAPA